METLHITNFCGVADAKLELRPINLFIGAQATGKSVVAKLVYFFREVISTLPNFAQAQTDWKVVRQQLGSRLVSYFGGSELGRGPFDVKYTVADTWLRVSRKGENSIEAVEFHTDRSFAALYGKLLDLIPKPQVGAEGDEAAIAGGDARVLHAKFIKIITTQIGAHACFHQLFIPAARASLALLSTQLLSQIATGQTVDVWMPKFAELVGNTRNILKERGFYDGKAKHESLLLAAEKTKAYHVRIREILRAEVEYDGTNERLKLGDGRAISLLRASSGQQESLPLLLLLGRFTMLPHVYGRSVFIEEPEAHLWPGAQREIVHLLAEMFLLRKNQMQLLLTTHSPYVFSVFNNLLEAGRAYAALDKQLASAENGVKRKLEERRKKLEEVVPFDRALPAGSIAAWQFDSGSVKPLVNEEYGVIGADLLDKVSEDIDVEWRNLQDFVE